jgi:hypothetical protein
MHSSEGARGAAMITTVLAVGVMLVVVAIAVSVTWQLSGVEQAVGTDQVVDTGDLVDGSGRVRVEDVPEVSSAARGAVLSSDAAAIARQISVLSVGRDIADVDVDLVLADYPREVDGLTIQASAANWSSRRTVTVSDGTSSLCVRFSASGEFSTSACSP